MTVSLRVSGVNSTIKDLERMFEEEVDKGLGDATNRAFDEAVRTTPEDTGFLKSRWSKRKTKEGYLVENDAAYADEVEFGTARKPGKRLIRQAFSKEFDDVDIEVVEGGVRP